MIAQVDTDQYNATLDSEQQHVRDFVVMHYWLTNRRDTPCWRDVAAMDIPASLKHGIELFRETGRVFRVPDELFAENSWIQVMLGQGVMPKQYHPIAGVMSQPDLSRSLDDIRSNVQATSEKLPAHMAYLRSYCPAPKPI